MKGPCHAETRRRSILNTSGDKRLTDWIRQVRPSQIPYIARVSNARSA